ncbi:arginine--tRNA ligase, cytoplasmic isoform X1 [Selaginella moellendorffii]|nr:arginine--tRNA ligase, cytoplasmic isoform X1 [Selaginella moellendorffii]|eukprot:XP_024533648.1 arginine--tRNA ligase, cytoplasmic isoform X1 [Selaginella moellendorffii]
MRPSCCVLERPFLGALAGGSGSGTKIRKFERRFRCCLGAMQDNAAAPALEIRFDTIRQELSKIARESFQTTLGEWGNVEPAVAACANPNFGDYQINNAMGIWSTIKGKETEFRNPREIAQSITRNFPQTGFVETTSVAGPGFINVKLSSVYIAKRLNELLLHGIDTWAPVLPVKRAIVDFSSPNIAKEMHVGHLRSTIIGDCLANMIEYCKVEVLRRNHVGDWGTQFGMLIEYLFEMFPNWEDIGDQAIGDLQAFYKESKVRFDADEEFKAKAQQAVVKLQSGDAKYRAAWKILCNISRNEFQQVYDRLKVSLEEKGESFYNPYIPDAIQILRDKGILEESDGATVIFVDGHKIPLIAIKRDGGFNYASTDLAALWYRLNVEKVEWIIYVTDVGQHQHFDMLFKAAKRAEWLPKEGYPRTQHVGFGLVLGADGKRFRTRQGTGLVRLVDLLDEAKSRSKTALIERGRDDEWSPEDLDAAAESVGYGAVKYADLKNNRETNYTFSFEQMLDVRGNTAVYLLYAYARIRSIIRKSGKSIDELKENGAIVLTHPDERALGLFLIQFSEVVEDAVTRLLPNTLCEYLYNLSENFTRFYTSCKVNGSPEETSRLLLCEATAIVMKQCFKLLGITPLERL